MKSPRPYINPKIGCTVHVILKLVIFRAKQKSPRKINLRVNYYLPVLSNILQKTTFPSPGPSQLQNFSFYPPPLATSCLRPNPGPMFLIFLSKIFLSHIKSFLFKISDDVILHVICGLGPSQFKILDAPMPEFKNFCI